MHVSNSFCGFAGFRVFEHVSRAAVAGNFDTFSNNNFVLKNALFDSFRDSSDFRPFSTEMFSLRGFSLIQIR